MRKLLIVIGVAGLFMVGLAAAPAQSQSLEGTLVVTKVVEGPVPEGTEFVITVDCPVTDRSAEVDPEGLGVSEELTFGEEGGSEEVSVPFFADECTVTETEDGGAASTTYAGEDVPGGCDVTANEDNAVVDFIEPVECEVTVTNTFEEEPPPPPEPEPAAQVVTAPTFTG